VIAIVLFLLLIFLMIEVALEREVEGDLFLQDIGQGFGFRPGSFDGAIRHVITTLVFALKKILFVDH
jgi:hypothetical protein